MNFEQHEWLFDEAKSSIKHVIYIHILLLQSEKCKLITKVKIILPRETRALIYEFLDDTFLLVYYLQRSRKVYEKLNDITGTPFLNVFFDKLVTLV